MRSHLNRLVGLAALLICFTATPSASAICAYNTDAEKRSINLWPKDYPVSVFNSPDSSQAHLEFLKTIETLANAAGVEFSLVSDINDASILFDTINDATRLSTSNKQILAAYQPDAAKSSEIAKKLMKPDTGAWVFTRPVKRQDVGDAKSQIRLILLRLASPDTETFEKKMTTLRKVVIRSFLGISHFIHARRCKTHEGLLGPLDNQGAFRSDDLLFLRHVYGNAE